MALRKLYPLAALAAIALPCTAMAQTNDAPEPPAIELQSGTIEQQIETTFADHDLAGVIYIATDEAVLLRKGIGEADPATGRMNRPETIFGIGSRPIDFTKAAILLLDQRGELSLDDSLSKYYPTAPADRAGMTLRHMMEGQSGLPDFPVDPSKDWDADLAWIGRAEFEQRTMAVPLLFAPGEGEAHSHWAFGVLTAIVERVSGQTYEEFLQTEFFAPAGMTHTGNYGARGDHAVEDFAVGGGVQVGLPNIPPNWGPTSWLVKGSGGMYSTLDDLLAFYTLVTSGTVLDEEHAGVFLEPSANVDGSERGFELFSYSSQNREKVVFLFLNRNGQTGIQVLAGPLIDYLRSD